MVCLMLALTYHFNLYRRTLRAEDGQISPWVRRVAGIASRMLWFSVGLAGRGIGLL
jgi:uncharacterized protein DUF6644